MLDVAADTRWTPAAIRALRERLRLTQEEFAELLGYDRRQSVTDWETVGADGEPKRRPSGSARVLLDIIDQHNGLPQRGGESGTH